MLIMLSHSEEIRDLESGYPIGQSVDIDELSEKIKTLPPSELEYLLTTSVDQNNLFLHKIMREGDSETCLLLLQKISRRALEKALTEVDSKGETALHIAIFEENKLDPTVLLYFIRKISFKAMNHLLCSYFDGSKDVVMIEKLIIDRCYSCEMFFYRLRPHNYSQTDATFADQFLNYRAHGMSYDQILGRRKAIYSFVSDNLRADDYEPEGFFSFFPDTIPDDPNDLTEGHIQWLEHVEFALQVAGKDIHDQLLALKIRLLYFSFLKGKGIPVDKNTLISFILDIHSFKAIDSFDCLIMADILSLTSFSRAPIEEMEEEKSDDFSLKKFFLMKRMQCLQAAIRKGRIDYLPLLGGLRRLLLDITGGKTVEVEEEKWELADEESFQLVIADNAPIEEQRKREMLVKISLGLLSITSLELFEQKILVEQVRALKEETYIGENNEERKSETFFEHIPAHEQDPSNFKAVVFEDFKEQNALLAKSVRSSLVAANDLSELEAQFQKYQAKFKSLEQEFLLKIKNELRHEILLQRKIWLTLQAEIRRLQSKNNGASKEQKIIFAARRNKIKSFLENHLQERNELVLKKRLLDLSSQMKAATNFGKWKASSFPSFRPSKGASILYALANNCGKQTPELGNASYSSTATKVLDDMVSAGTSNDIVDYRRGCFFKTS